MKIVIDNKVPFLRGLPERLGFATRYLAGAAIGPADVADADALIVRTRTLCNEALLGRSRVQFIATATIGYDHLDVSWLRRAGISWTNCPGCNATAVAQYVDGTLSALVAAGRVGKAATVGIVGVGHVGEAVRQRVVARGMEPLLCDPPRQERGDHESFVSLQTVAQRADVITFHVPLTATGPHPTHYMADEAFFSSLQWQPALINSSRGGVVNEAAWLRALASGRAGAAVVDTWEHEPHPDSALLQQAFIATPHIAGYSLEGKANASRMALTAVCRFFGVQPDFSIELPHLNAPAPAYNPLADTARLKAAPDQFEWLRSHYELRREH